MTCPALRRSTTLTTTVVAEVLHGVATGARRVSRPVTRLVRSIGGLLRAISRGEGTASQFSRFVFVGGVSSALYAVLFVSLSGVDAQLANTVGAVASTLLANEMHRRTTFHAGGRVTWLTAQVEGGGLAVVGLVATSLALAAFHQIAGDDVSAIVQLLVIGGVTGAIGLVRFVALRAWVFKSPAVDEVEEHAGSPALSQSA